MPTERHGHIRRLLKNNQAKVIKRCPFTIQLLYDTDIIVQDIDLGIDSGSKHIGACAANDNKVYYLADIELRNDIVDLLSSRRELRRSRRNRKTRYRKKRFDNRVRSKHKGWLAPSVENKIQTHIKQIEDIFKILPIKRIVIESAAFDIQKIKNPDIDGTEYQQGEQLNFWNVREYVLFRDGHQCQNCKGKSKDSILNVHHIESRKVGGNAPNNLITLCETCHKMYHNGKIALPSIHRGMKFNDAAFMGIMRWTLLNRVKALYEPRGIEVANTYGYITKNVRIEHNLPKEHYIDALCISGHPTADMLDCVYYKKRARRHNRQLHKCTILKGGIRKSNQAPKEVKGFRLFDKVKYNGKEYTVFGRRTSGFFDIRTLDGQKVNNGSVSYKKLKLINHQSIIIERRPA